MLNLDTHVLIFALAGELRVRERKVLDGAPWGISDIVLWEVAKLRQLGRLDIDLGDRDVKRMLGTVHVWPITLEIAKTSTALDFRGDPADEIIAATSIVEEVPLLTRDQRIKKSKLIAFA